MKKGGHQTYLTDLSIEDGVVQKRAIFLFVFIKKKCSSWEHLKSMKTVTEFQIESEKELELLYAKQEEEISFNDEVMMSLKDLHSELALLKSTLAEMSQKIDKLDK